MTGIVLDGVTKRFGDVVAVDDIDLEVRDGELLVLVGPSGCGKTTLLRLIAGLERPTTGEIYLDGRRVTDVPTRKRDIALVFQSYALFPHMNVRENLSFNLRMQGYDDIDGRVDRIADLLDVAGVLDRDIDELSGGQKQRVALGRAIVSEPTAFLLDEPLANLDANLREEMETEIVRLQRRLDTTTVHVTHNQQEALTIGDRIAVMQNGEIQQIGSPEEVYTEPANLFVSRFIGSPTMNFFDGHYDPKAGRIEIGESTDERVALVVDGGGENPRDVVVGVRPKHVDVLRSPDADAAIATGTIELVEFRGADRIVFLRSPHLPQMVARVNADASVEEGSTVGLGIDPSSVHVFDVESGERVDAPCRTIVEHDR